jgi:uncharacterized protein (TIGR02246 family)
MPAKDTMRMKTLTILSTCLLILCAGCHVKVKGPDTSADDQADIKALEDRFMTAFRAKDLNAVMSCYVPDDTLVVFDTTPPRQYVGAAAYRKDFQDFFANVQGPIDATISDLEVTTGGGSVAYSHSIQYVASTDKAGKRTEVTARVTDAYKRINGKWLISHEHVSVPVDMTAMKPVLDSK